MIWLQNKDTSGVVHVTEQSSEYAYLRGIKSSVDNRPLYEEIGLPEAQAANAAWPFGRFALARYLNAATVAANAYGVSLGASPADGAIVSAAVVTAAPLVGQATNFRTLSLIDDGTPANSGGAYAQIAPVTLGTTALSAGVTIPAGVETAMGSVTGTVAVNDILRFQSAVTSAGMLLGDCCLIAVFTRKS